VISTPVALLVLLSAVMHAGWNYLVKASADRLLDTLAITLGGSLLAAVLLPFVPLPTPAAWPWLGLTVLLHVGYFAGLIQSYRYADLSVAYPLMRGTAPLLVALVAPLLGDPLSPGLLAGVLLIGTGIGLPAWIGIARGAVSWKGAGYALGNSFFIAAYTLSDGIGVRASGNAVSYTLWLFFLNAFAILLIARWRRGSGFLRGIGARWRRATAGSLLTILSYGIVLWAMSISPIPAVAALRETSVIFAALLGACLLKESMGRWRTIGALLVTLGAASIRWG
jgi:drug/metabolite transporter (DMT)-like permease